MSAVADSFSAHYPLSDEEVVHIRRMTENDLDVVDRIEQGAFIAPWSRRAFAHEVTENQIAIPLVATMGGMICGYVVAWAAAHELHIGTIAVHPAWRRRGIARCLLEEIFRQAQKRRCRRAYLEVRRSNAAAQKLYERLGFQFFGVRRNYYALQHEDAIVMSKPLVCGEGENGLV